MTDNVFESLAAQERQRATGAPAPMDDTFNALAEQERQRQQALAAQLTRAVAVNPDTYNAQRKAAESMGLPPFVGETVPNITLQAQAQKIQKDVAGNPALQKAYGVEDFAKLAHDDSGTLSSIASAIRGGTRYLMGADGQGGLPRDLYTGVLLNSEIASAGIGRALSEWAAAPLNLAGLDKVTSIGGNPLQRLAEGFAQIAEGAQAEKKRVNPDREGIVATGVSGGVQSAAQMGKYMPLAFLGPPGIAAALTGMVAEAGGMTYQEDRQKGVGPGTAGLHAATDMVAEYVGEKYLGAAGLLTRIAAGSSVGKLMVYEITKEIPGEIGTTLWQNFNDWALIDPSKSITDFVKEQPAAVAQTIISTLVGGTIQIGTAKAGVKLVENVLGQQLASTEATQASERLQDQLKLATGSLLRERNPTEFRTLVAAMSEDAELHLDAGVFNQLSPEVLAQMPQSVQDQLANQITDDTLITVPTADVLTIAPGTPLEQFFTENARLNGPNSMSQAEAKDAGAKAQEFLQQESEHVIAQAVDQQAWQASHDAVKQTVLDQLNAVGRFRKDVNEGSATMFAAMYTTIAGELGITPEQAWAQDPIVFTDKTGKGAVLNAGKTGEITVEGFHFSKADRSFVSTSMYGTGLQGSNREAFKNAKDKRLAKRGYFYADTGTGINPEAGVGGRGHKATLTNVYDSNTDPLRLKGGSQEDFESKVLDAGFSGYLDRLSGSQSGQVIMLGDQDIPVEQLGGLGKTTGQRVDPAGTREAKGRDAVVDALNANTALPAGSPTLARWQQLLAKSPEVLQALTDAGVFAGDQTANVYKSELIKRFIQATPSESYAQQSQALQAEIEQAGGKVNDILQVEQLISSDEIPTITLQDLVGLDIFPTIADRTAAAAVYSGIDSSRLDVAIPLLGGPLFPLRETNVEAGVVWANRGKGVTGQKAAKLKAGANHMMVLLGDADMHQSNSTVAAAVMGTLESWQRDGRLNTEQVEALADLVRAAPSSDAIVKGYLENFPGFDDASIMHGYMDGMSFNARKRVIELLASKEALALGAPPMNLILDATREPSMAGHRWGDGVILLEVDQVNTQVELGTEGTTPHPDFPVGIRGRVVGKLNAPISWQMLWQDWLNANNGASPRRAFELAKPIVTVTQELVDRIGPINQNNIDSARQARLAADFAADNWRQTGVAVNKGGASPQEFVDAILTTAARPVLTEYSLDQVKQGAKDGSFKVFQLGADGRIFFGMKYGDPGYAADYGIDIPEITSNEVALVSVVNNEQGARGLTAPAVVLKALQQGATVLDCFAVKNEKYRNGFLPSLYAAFGFEKVAEIPFAPEYYSAQKLADAVKFWKDTTPGFDPATSGFPPLVIMKWKGTDADRSDIINRYLRDGLPGVLARGASTDVEAFAAYAGAPAGAADSGGGTSSDAQRTAGDQGARDGAPVASRARGTIQGIAKLNDGELRNLGLTVADRSAVQRALGTPATDNAVLAQQAEVAPLAQGPRGTFNPKSFELALNPDANLSTVHHEMAHAYLEILTRIAARPNPPDGLMANLDRFLKWQGIADLDTWNAMTLDQKRPHHEALAEGYEQYLLTGKAPSVELQPLMRKLKAFMLNVYKSLKAFVASRGPVVSGGAVLGQAQGEGYEGADAGEAAEWLAAKAKGLDMSTEARMVRAKAMGFDDTPWYHGTNKDVSAFKTSRGKGEPGVWFTDDPDLASDYAEARRSPGKSLAPGANITPVLLKTRSFDDVWKDGEAWSPDDHEAAFLSKGDSQTGGVVFHDTKDYTTSYSNATRRKTHNTAVVFQHAIDRGAVRSVFAAFDPDRAYSGNLLAQNNEPSNLALPPEMVQFYDRMLASEEQIAQAEEVAGLLPNEDATAEAIEKLTARSLRDLKWSVNARNREIKALQDQAKELRKGVEAEMRAEVDAMPAYEAKDALAKLKKEGPLADAQIESIAEKYGFTSVDEMLRTIDATGSKADAIEGMTDQRMLERHGDLIDQRAIEAAANEAVHNEARARSLATELRSQAEALNPRQDTGKTSSSGAKITVNAIVAAAKQFAANVVGRSKVLKLKALAAQHIAAERRAGKRWQEATAKGKTAEAIKAKQDQVLNNAAAKAALEAQGEMSKVVEYLKKFDKESVRKKLPPEYLDQIDKLLERIDLRVSVSGTEIDRRASLAKWIESQNALGIDPVIPEELMENIKLTSFKEMTVDQLRDLTESIKNIEHIGRLKSKLLAAKDKREFDIIATEIADGIRANGGKPRPVQLEPDGKIKKFFKGAWADHRKMNSLVHQMDGGKDNGFFYKALIAPMNERGTQENVGIEKATEALAKIYAPIENLPGGISGAKLFIPEIKNSMSRAGRLSIALNWGNTQNRQRVMDGDAWTEAQVNAILATLSPVELQFVNDVWAHIDSYWPDVAAKQLRVSGVVEEKVEAEPFVATASDGTQVQMRGGYYPIKYDGDRSLKAQKNESKQIAEDIMRGAVLRPTTRRSHTKARVEEVVGRPVRKDLSAITQHVNQVVHDLAWHEWTIDAIRLLNDPRIAGAIREHYGPEIHRAMTDSMEAIAVGNVAQQTSIDTLLLAMRSNVTRSIMGASLTTALLQPFGLTQSMARIGVMPVLKGAGRWAGDAMRMENTVGWIQGKSEFMRLRGKTFNRELREISQRVAGKSKIMQITDASLFMLMQKMQMVADVPTWVGAYEKALAGGVDEDAAIGLADEAVLSSQGGGDTKDLSSVQRNLPFLTQFYSYFNTTLQLVIEKTALTNFKNPKAVAGWLGDMALLTVIPAILPALLTHALKGGGDDDEPEDWAKRLAAWQASYLFGMFVGLRELPTLWSPFDYGGPPAGKLINDGKRLVQQAGQGEVDDAAVLATIGFLGTALGLPTTQLLRSYKGWLAWDEGDAPATSILFGPPPRN
jgi:hypothetical protein